MKRTVSGSDKSQTLHGTAIFAIGPWARGVNVGIYGIHGVSGINSLCLYKAW